MARAKEDWTNGQAWVTQNVCPFPVGSALRTSYFCSLAFFPGKPSSYCCSSHPKPWDFDWEEDFRALWEDFWVYSILSVSDVYHNSTQRNHTAERSHPQWLTTDSAFDRLLVMMVAFLSGLLRQAVTSRSYVTQSPRSWPVDFSLLSRSERLTWTQEGQLICSAATSYWWAGSREKRKHGSQIGHSHQSLLTEQLYSECNPKGPRGVDHKSPSVLPSSWKESWRAITRSLRYLLRLQRYQRSQSLGLALYEKDCFRFLGAGWLHLLY